MMARAHEVAVGADGREFERAVKQQIIKPMEQAVDAVDDLGKSRGPEQLEDDLRGAQKETKELADETKRTAQQIDRSYRDAGRDIKKGIGDGLDDAKSEVSSSAREGAASFTGEWSDVGDFIQESLANALSGLGPIGAAAGIAAAAGLGIITSTILGQQEAADELKRRLSDAYKDAAEEGRAYLNTAQIIADASDLLYNEDRLAERNRVIEDAKQLGLDFADVAAANAGAQDKQRLVQERINALLDAANEKNKYLPEQYRETADGPLKAMADRWQTVIAETDRQIANARTLGDVQSQIEQDRREQINRTADAAQARYEGLAALYGKPITGTVVLEVDDSNVVAAQRRAEAWARNGLRVAVTGTLGGDYWE